MVTLLFSSPSHVWLLGTPWTAAHQASLSLTISQSWFRLLSIESMMPSTISFSVVPFSIWLQSFPASGSFSMNQLFASDGQSIGASASLSVLPINIQGWFPLGLISFRIDLLKVQGTLKSLLQHHSTNYQCFLVQPSLWSNSHTRTGLLEKP